LSQVAERPLCHALGNRGRSASPFRRAASVDQFGGRREQGTGNGETQSLRGRKVDDKLELTRSLNRQVCGACTSKTPSDIVAPQSSGDAQSVGVIAHQAPTIWKLTSWIHYRNPVARCQLQYCAAILRATEQREAANDKRIGALFDKFLEGSLEVGIADFQYRDFSLQRPPRGKHLTLSVLENRGD